MTISDTNVVADPGSPLGNRRPPKGNMLARYDNKRQQNNYDIYVPTKQRRPVTDKQPVTSSPSNVSSSSKNEVSAPPSLSEPTLPSSSSSSNWILGKTAVTTTPIPALPEDFPIREDDDDDDYIPVSPTPTVIGTGVSARRRGQGQGQGQLWGRWEAWSNCSQSCGGGVQERSRWCLEPGQCG